MAPATRFDNMIGGSVSGMFAVTMSYPFDLVKTRLQFEIAKGNRVSIPTVSKTIWSEGYAKGLFGVKPLGAFVGFYRGLDQLIPEAAFKVMLRFFAYKEIQELYRINVMGLQPGTDAPMTLPGNLISGAIAGFVEAAVVVQPFERGKTLRADFQNPYAVWGQAFRSGGPIVGLRSIYAGFVPCAGRQVGNQAFGFTTFYGLKNWYLKRTGKDDLANHERLGLGFIGGCTGASMTMPLDTAKTIAQKAQPGDNVGNMFQILAKVVREQGFLGMYTGLAPRLMRVGLDRAFGFLAFEWILEKLRERREEGN